MRKLQPNDLIELTYGMKVYSSDGAEVIIGDSEKFCEGKYVVEKCEYTGGDVEDQYPDGWNVECFNLKDHSIRINFYQSGCFNIVHSNILPVGKVKITKSVEILKRRI